MIIVKRRQTGYILLEVLITIVILVIGLLGLAGLQLRTSLSESEAYQRGQAMVVVQDMTDRIYANRNNAAAYIMNDIGTATFDCTTAPTVVQSDICAWNDELLGASEQLSSVSVGTLLGGRGCITAGASAQEVVVTVVWQGLVPTVAPSDYLVPTNVLACGKDQYGTDTLRRAVSMRVLISTLSAGVL
jgi:type IV pilus assembly protein PilV